jgi:hypothetical protein
MLDNDYALKSLSKDYIQVYVKYTISELKRKIVEHNRGIKIPWFQEKKANNNNKRRVFNEKGSCFRLTFL